MSASMEEGPLREAAIFARAVENVFRKLIRLLLGRMTLARLQEMIRIVYIEEAEQKLQRERPDKKVSLTKLALLTGLDTRTLNKHLKSDRKSQDYDTHERFLRDITPESSILDFWSSRTEYLELNSQKPLVLPLKGDTPSFESLTKQVSVARGVTMSSILSRLEKSDSIRINHDQQTVELLQSRFMPFTKKGMSEALEVGFITVGNLVDTLVYNLEKKEESDTPFFQRSNWTTRLNQSQLEEFRKTVRSSLTDCEKKVIKVLARFEEDSAHDDQVTAGFSMFYFDENSID